MTALPHLRDTGEGPPVLLLHALPQDGTQWDAQVAALSGRYRCLRPDAFGCGASAPPPDGLGVDSWAGAIVAALDAAGVGGRVAVVGSSMGGYVAFGLLRAHADRVAALALLGSRAGPDDDDARARRLQLAARARSEGAAAIEELARTQPAALLGPASIDEFHISDPVRGRIRRCTPAGIAALAEALAARPDCRPLLEGIAVPTLVAHGADDGVIPFAEAEEMAGAIPGARLEVVEGAGHLLNLERPEVVSGFLGEFLDALPRW